MGDESRDTGAWAQLRDRDFARLLGARFVSAFGTTMAPVAMAFGVLELTDSARMVGLVLASQTAAQVLTQLFGGALADRFSRRRVMLVADVVASASQAGMAVLLIRGDAPVPALVALMAVMGVCFAFHWPATIGIVPQIVPPERLQPANALLSLAQSSAFGLGGAAAGVIVAVAGAGWAIAADAGTFLMSAVLVFGIRPGPQARSDSSSLLVELRDGWREFTHHRWLWTIVLQYSLLVAAWNGAFMVLGPVFANRSLGGAADWGFVASALGVGLMAGGFLGIRLHVRRPLLVATLCMLLFPAPLVCMGIEAPLALIVGATFVAGVVAELFAVYWNTAFHTHVAPEALSRVSAYDVVGSIALAPIGEALAGPLAEWIGLSPAMLLAATLIITPTLLVLLVPEVRHLESRPPHREQPPTKA